MAGGVTSPDAVGEVVGLSWTRKIHDVAVRYMNAEVIFYNVDDDQPDEIVELWRGKARVQHLREPRDSSTVYGEFKTRRYRFQLDPDDGPPYFKSGVSARVLSGGDNPDLLKLVYVVDSMANASHRAVVTVELRAEMVEHPPLIASV